MTRRYEVKTTDALTNQVVLSDTQELPEHAMHAFITMMESAGFSDKQMAKPLMGWTYALMQGEATFTVFAMERNCTITITILK